MLTREEIFPFMTMSRLILAPTKPSTYLALGGGRQLKHETDHSPNLRLMTHLCPITRLIPATCPLYTDIILSENCQ
jgi:hypothetical protein